MIILLARSFSNQDNNFVTIDTRLALWLTYAIILTNVTFD